MRKLASSNLRNEIYLTGLCPMQYTMRLVSGRWKIIVLWYIHAGVVRFGEMRKRVGMVTTKVLSQQLRELEADGLISRTVCPGKSLKVEYALTERGASLIPVLAQLNAWGVREQRGQPCGDGIAILEEDGHVRQCA